MSDDFINLPQSIDLNIKKTAPQTEIYLARGIEWDNSYIHARAYNSSSELLSHVISKVPSDDYHITNSAPVRTGKATVKIQANEAVAMKLNYMAFRNMPYDSEWHFAFINNVTWLSADSVIIDFELDVFSECYYTTNFLPCFIERMHIPKSEDVAGANVVPDDIETGVMECYYHTYIDLGLPYVGLYVTKLVQAGDENVYKHYLNNMYSGLYYTAYKMEDELDAQQIDALIKKYEGKEDAIQNMVMFPGVCVPTEDGGFTTLTHSSQIDLDFGYSPKNQKLFTYPYVYCNLDDNGGNVVTYKPELFSGNNWEFKVTGCAVSMPQVMVRPTNYCGLKDNFQHAFVISNFPICAWSYDTYKAWVAQNKNSLALSKEIAYRDMGKGFISAGMTLAGSMATGNMIGAAIAGQQAGSALVSGMNQIQSLEATKADKDFLPPTARGKINVENIRFAMGLDRVDLYAMRPKISMCKVIDDFWTAFGYPIHQITTPQIHSRSSWNYIKTVDCAFTADAEMSMLSKYRDLFNKGITIWHTDQIGNYNLSNV